MDKITQIVISLIEIGVREEDSALFRLRAKALAIFMFFNIGFLLYFIILLLLRNEDNTSSYLYKVNGLSLVLFLISLLFLKYRKLNLGAILAGTMTVLAVSNLSYGETLTNSTSSPEIGLVIAFITILINGQGARIIFLVISLAILGYITYDILNDFHKTRSLLQEDMLFMSLFYFFVIGLERIDELLSNTMTKLVMSNKKNTELNEALHKKNSELITFSHIMSHDLKTPIRMINSFSSLLGKKFTLKNSKEEEYVSYIKDNAEFMQNLIDDLLQFMSISHQSFEMTPVQLNDIIDEVISVFRVEVLEKKMTVVKNKLPQVLGNRQLIKAVIQNLVSNSIKYQPKNEDHRPRILIRGEDEGDKYNLYVEDNGIGIDETYIPSLFEPFKRSHATSDYKGTGLGLSICKQVMNKMGGNIKLEETSQMGSVFKLTFLNVDTVTNA